MSERHPIGYLGELVDVANAVLFLASDEARFITGAINCRRWIHCQIICFINWYRILNQTQNNTSLDDQSI